MIGGGGLGCVGKLHAESERRSHSCPLGIFFEGVRYTPWFLRHWFCHAHVCSTFSRFALVQNVTARSCNFTASPGCQNCDEPGRRKLNVINFASDVSGHAIGQDGCLPVQPESGLSKRLFSNRKFLAETIQNVIIYHLTSSYYCLCFSFKISLSWTLGNRHSERTELSLSCLWSSLPPAPTPVSA